MSLFSHGALRLIGAGECILSLSSIKVRIFNMEITLRNEMKLTTIFRLKK
jgi:hypothetical protein